MNDFKTKTPARKILDLNKRVKYTRGLVMGVHEFEQEQVYFIEKNRLHNRALHGYGTVCGLHVSVEDGDGPEAVVSAGIAVNPMGQEIRVPFARCAPLNRWLETHRDEVISRFGSPPLEKVSVYVVLCYSECDTDKVIIAGEPCGSREFTPSRIADYFELSLRFSPPAVLKEEVAPLQLEEEAVRKLGKLLDRIEMTDGQGMTREEMESLVRAIAGEESPPGSPPPGSLLLNVDEACGILHAVLRVWVTEVRPKILEKGGNCSVNQDGTCSCVRLARLEFPVEEVDGRVLVKGNAFDVVIDENDRPILLHSRLLQEWLVCRWPGLTSLPSLISPGFREAPVIARELRAPVFTGPQPAKLLPFVSIERVGPTVPTGEGVYELWFNFDMFITDTPESNVEIDMQSLKDHLKIFKVTKSGTSYLKEIEDFDIIKARERNTVKVKIKKDFNMFSFSFDISKIKLKDGMTIKEYAVNNRIYFIGYDGGKDTVTALVRKR